ALVQANICSQTEANSPNWPWLSEKILSPLYEAEIRKRGVQPFRFLAKKGDVLIWHGNLAHRGSRAKDMNLERKSLIAHFSGIRHRADMPPAVQHGNGGWYF